MVSTVFIVDPKPPKSDDQFHTLNSATRRLFLISRLFCASPLLPQSDPPYTRVQRGRIAVQVLWTLVFFATITVCMVFQHLQFDGSKHSIQKFLYTISYFISTGNNVMILIGTYAQRGYYQEFFREIAVIDERLSRMAGAIDQNLMITMHYVALGRFVSFWLLIGAAILSVSLVCDLFYNELVIIAFVRSVIVYIVPNTSDCLILLQFMTALRLLSLKYRAINRMLRGFERKNESKPTMVANPAILPLHLQSGRWEATLQAARIVHIRLGRMHGELTDAFAYILCGMFVWTLLVLTIQLYEFFKWAEKLAGNREWLMAYSLVWLVLYAGRMLALLVLSDRLTGEQRKVVRILYGMDLGVAETTAGMDRAVGF